VISTRWPLPHGVSRSIARRSGEAPGRSRRSRSLGRIGVRAANGTRVRRSATVPPLIDSTCSNAKYFSPRRGGRTGPASQWPCLRLSRRIWLGLT
jgi:hypothetical protein